MIEFIIKNKEWLFSGIGVFLIAGSCVSQTSSKKKAEDFEYTDSFANHNTAVISTLTANFIGAERLTPDADENYLL